MKLVIVESPAKARTIEKFLGKDYRVLASYGHIRDLPGSAAEIPASIKDKPWARMGVDVENGFTPVYVVGGDSRKQVAALRKEIKKADELLLATDQDREGEAISWHLVEVLKPKVPIRRITFHEITREAIDKALAEPGEIEEPVVRAQESRRILDRLFGYSLSPVLWKKVRSKLSAGRVQSVGLRLIVEREEERQAFQKAQYWDVEAHLDSTTGRFSSKLIRIGDKKLAGGKDFDADTGELKVPGKQIVLDGERASHIAQECLKQLPWKVGTVEQSEKKQRPKPPFTTSTLQQAASSLLGMSPKRTMMVAQRLYEGIQSSDAPGEGLITYMRTDSLTLSERALSHAEQLIKESWGPEYTSGPRRYKTKSKGAQEAHEAIRPTDLSRTPDRVAAYLDHDELELYRLIWKRTIASQMTDARVDRTKIDFDATLDGEVHVFRATGSVVRFPGFLKVMGGAKGDAHLPDLKEGQAVGGSVDGLEQFPVNVEGADARGHETSPPPRFTEAALVKKLEEEGIGRPSTYAPTISVIQARGYVEKRSGALVPSYIGMAVTYLLRNHFQRFVNVRFTAGMEEQLDDIAAGRIDWTKFLEDFYYGEGDENPGLLKRIEDQLPKIDYPAIPVGRDPASGKEVVVRIGRTYVYVQLGEEEDAARATLPVELMIDELTVEKALELIEQRKKSLEPIGTHPESGQNIYALVGPYGPYVQLGEVEKGSKKKPKRVSLLRGTRVEDIDLPAALKLLELPRLIGEDPETGKKVTAGIGRFGPYVERARVFVSLKDPAELFTIGLEDAIERINNKNRKEILKELGTHPETGEPLNVLKGRWGPYVTNGEVNANIGRKTSLESFTLETALELLAEAAKKKKPAKKKTTKKKVAKKKTTKKKTTKKVASRKKTGV